MTGVGQLQWLLPDRPQLLHLPSQHLPLHAAYITTSSLLLLLLWAHESQRLILRLPLLCPLHVAVRHLLLLRNHEGEGLVLSLHGCLHHPVCTTEPVLTSKLCMLCYVPALGGSLLRGFVNAWNAYVYMHLGHSVMMQSCM